MGYTGGDKLQYDSKPDADVLSRPLDSSKDFDWNSGYGLYLQGKAFMDQKMYAKAEEKLSAALGKTPGFVPALVQMTELMYRNMRYREALVFAKTALSVDTHDGAANYYYGIVNNQLGNTTDAKDGFDLASLTMAFRSPAYRELSKLYLAEKNWDKALNYATKAIDFNRYEIGALQVQAIAYRHQNKINDAKAVLDTILVFDPLNDFARFEKYLIQPSAENKSRFTAAIRNEQPTESYLELAVNYYQMGRFDESEQALQLAPDNALVNFWLAFLQNKKGQSFASALAKADQASAAFVFPFRSEDEAILLWANKQLNSWKPKYYLALLYQNRNQLTASKELFKACGNTPDFAPFYAARAAMHIDASELTDLKRAQSLDQADWRYTKLLGEYYLSHNQNSEALKTIEPFYQAHTENYIMGMLYAKALLLNKRYADCAQLLDQIQILPFEGATIGRELYREAKLMQAINEIKLKHYKQALSLISDAKKWPQNLGVGRPYAENIDERLENWMDYLCYQKMGNQQAAQTALQQVTGFKPKIENTVSNFTAANQLLTAWAMEKLGQKQEARAWLNQQVKQYPKDAIIKWCQQVFLHAQGVKADTTDSGVRLIEQIRMLK
ncbi:hypothetical protein G7074_25535 [Pedobacter sp. HDW13]|uniref:tetratricopeptide repeat protein n=1 Tax=Pedobacter sp. HDW13 TaxID=2714940 RepID=UPI0014093D9B|nr:hypothetical protein [Pedobacter sp. HDW13]QIL42324.1 hypothetical protein G7074_25535 [Pedobacter sp. HDW13]